MSVSVVGHWELSWNTPIKEAELWNLPLRDFGVEDWWMWPVSGIRHNEQKVRLSERRDLNTILDHVTNQRVFIEPRGFYDLESIDLPDFTHPEDVTYIFGSAHFNPTIGSMGPDDVAVTIPTIGNAGVLWPHQCLVTILYDRMVKSWQ